MDVKMGFKQGLFAAGLYLLTGAQVLAGGLQSTTATGQEGRELSIWDEAFPNPITDRVDAHFEQTLGLLQLSAGVVEVLLLDELVRRVQPAPVRGRVLSRAERLKRLELGMMRGTFRLGQVPGVFLLVDGATRFGLAVSGRSPGSLPSINLGTTMVKRMGRNLEPSVGSEAATLRAAP